MDNFYFAVSLNLPEVWFEGLQKMKERPCQAHASFELKVSVGFPCQD